MKGNYDQSKFRPCLSELAWGPEGQESFLPAHSSQTLKSSTSCNKCQGAEESRLGTSRRSSDLSGLLTNIILLWALLSLAGQWMQHISCFLKTFPSA